MYASLVRLPAQKRHIICDELLPNARLHVAPGDTFARLRPSRFIVIDEDMTHTLDRATIKTKGRWRFSGGLNGRHGPKGGKVSGTKSAKYYVRRRRY